MDFQCDNNLDLLSICRCCLKGECFKDISTEYYKCRDNEVMEEMLNFTFDIQVSNNSPSSKETRSLICDDCVRRLRDAFTFKKMVMRNLVRLQKYLDVCKFDKSKKSAIHVKNSDTILEATYETDSEIFHANDNLEEYNALVIKQEECWLEDDSSKSSKKRVIAQDMEVVRDKHKHSKVETNLLDRRGKTPIIRENSLKLMANSTICAFQWNKGRYRCFVCTEPFNEMSLLREHTNTQHSLSNIERKIIRQQNRLVKVDVSIINCKVCKETCPNLDNLQNHLHNAHNIEFTSPEHLLVPFKIQNGGLTCQICFENFNLFRLLNIHMNRHYKKHICDVCGSCFSNLVFLNLHKTRLHRPLKCTSCDLTFKSKVDKRNHDVKVHDIKRERRKRFPCQYCSERFLQESKKVLHLVEKHDLIRPEHSCRFCSKTFITKSLVNNHVKYVHLKEKVHDCDICHSCFYTKSDLNRHKGTHSGEKKFPCSVCNILFASKDSLRRHSKRTHSE